MITKVKEQIAKQHAELRVNGQLVLFNSKVLEENCLLSVKNIRNCDFLGVYPDSELF